MHTQYCWPHTHAKLTLGGFTRGRPDGFRRATDLQVRDVPVDVHGGGDAVFRDVLEAVGVRLAVHAVDAGDGDPLLAQSDVTANTALAV